MRPLVLLALVVGQVAGLPLGARAWIAVPCWADVPVDPICPRALYSLAFSADGRTLAAGLEDGRVQLWAVCPPPAGAPPLALRATLPAGWTPVYAVAFSPGNDRLAAVCSETAVNLWNVTDQNITGLPGYRGRVLDLEFSPDGSLLASGGGVFVTCGEVFLWQMTAPGSPPQTPATASDVVPYTQFVGHRHVVSDVAFSPDGKLLASAGGRFLCPGEVYVWDVQKQAPLNLLPPQPDQAVAVAFSLDSRTLAVATRDGKILLWDVATGRLCCWWQAHSLEVTFLAFACDGRVLVSAGADARVKFWDPVFGWPLAGLKDPCWQRAGGDVMTAALSADGRLLATGSVCGRLQLWDLRPLLGPLAPAPGK